MIIYYFGADEPWHDQHEHSIIRRNMAILKAISEQKTVDRVYNVIRSQRNVVFANMGKRQDVNSIITNIYIAPILPERGFLKKLMRPLNRWLLKKIHHRALNSTASKSLAWCYWPKGFEDFEFLNLKMDMIFDTDHNIINDPNIIAAQKFQRKDMLLRAGKRAKYVLSSSRSMLKWYNDNGCINTKILMNGVSKHRINLSPEVTRNTNYTVTYCGTLSKWIKKEWLFKIISVNPDWRFNFIGRNYKTTIESELQKHPNVTLLGQLEPIQVDAVLKQSDVCFGLYQEDDALDVNSMKLYDYLAQNKPVIVNNYHPNLEQDFHNILNIATNYEEFESLIKHPRTTDVNRLEHFLKISTWDSRVKTTLNEILA